MQSMSLFLLIGVITLLFSCNSNFNIASTSPINHRSAAADCSDAADPEACDTASRKTKKSEKSERAMKLRMANCVDPDLSKVLNTESITLCDGTQAKGTLIISAAEIVSGATIAGVAGSVVLPAASEVLNGVTFGEGGTAITGSKFPTKQCRNGADLASWDTSGLSGIGISNPNLTANASNVDVTTDEINLNVTSYYLKPGFPIQISSTITMPGGLTEFTTYYVIVSGNKIKLAESPGGAAIDITTTGSGSLRFYVVGDGVVDQWDTIDDMNGGSLTSPNLSPWGSSFLCNEENFTNVSMSGDPGMTPSNNTPAGASAPFTEIWRDDLTGLHFSNLLYAGSGSVNWSGAMEMCAGLDSGDGAGNWRIPTQKELLQLYINGISKVPTVSGGWGTLNGYIWSSTTILTGGSSAWGVSLDNAEAIGNFKGFTDNGIICVR